MASFTLSWTPVITGNVIAQRAYFRQKTVGGAFLTTGFSPANDMGTGVSTTARSGLTDNVVYEFKIANICTIGGPTDNTDGIKEQIQFACVTPTVTKTATTGNCAYTGLPADITKVRFRLRLTADNSSISGPTTVTVVGGAASVNVTSLTPATDYYFETEFFAVVDGIEVVSSAAAYLNAVCGPYGFVTDAVVCPAPTGLTVVTSPA